MQYFLRAICIHISRRINVFKITKPILNCRRVHRIRVHIEVHTPQSNKKCDLQFILGYLGSKIIHQLQST